MQPSLVKLLFSHHIADVLTPNMIAIHVYCILCIAKDGSELPLLPKRIAQTIWSAETKLNLPEYLALKESLWA